MNPITLTIICKNEEKTYKEKHLLYHGLRLDSEDDNLKKLIGEAKENCGFDPDDVSIRLSMEM